ncbi:hypothetical protein VNO80_15843 [Phaseolus coccineus]|uniref:Uncharacterized protein n=1 Tax=Phaseolus coccineus TaxID=3886 RepID=A0AAN9R3C3_PHACN
MLTLVLINDTGIAKCTVNLLQNSEGDMLDSRVTRDRRSESHLPKTLILLLLLLPFLLPLLRSHSKP